ncbi:hypothetical protein [Bradyrhizobium sp. CCBAU 11357]|uniref:hypothetical protein n=1 Tax=Bradyrhizobium sp. CCBAU 11357 TaxID=1630808 RepID=UPI0023044EBE|nr:hypothetical protein [Bradyrhizobium sp. CCBAU 11357]MDA9499266.1 hypothetical protein [Bradyrhizobium sp. CCBAU 11357]
MFIRFVVHEIDSSSRRRQGLFRAVQALEDSGGLTVEDAKHLSSICGWFDEHLREPERLAISSHHHGKAQAISWFKDTATNHVAKMRQLAEVLVRYGVPVEMIKTKRLGYILYEDEFQVAAFPFNDTPT